MMALANEDVLGGLDRLAGAGSVISLKQASTSHPMKEEKVPEVTDDMGDEREQQFETGGAFHLTAQKL